MSKKTIDLNERDLIGILKSSMYKILEEQSLIREMSLPMGEFSSKLHSKLWSVFENLACICIFQDVNKDILPHWAERAAEPFIPWFSQDITKETHRRRVSAINKAFNMMFNKDYSAITAKSFQDLITYYEKRPDKNLRIYATNSAEYYFVTYKDSVVNMLKIMKECLIKRDSDSWITAVNGFYEKFLDDNR